MADVNFRYNEGATRTQVLIPVAVRNATNTVAVAIRNPEMCVVRFRFLDVPDVPNRVTPIFKTLETGRVFVPEVPVEAPSIDQIYLLGHGNVVPSGVVAKITGQTEGPGMGVMVDYNLEIEAIDQLLARGFTGHSLLIPTNFVIEIVHDGGADITYSASITLGDLGA